MSTEIARTIEKCALAVQLLARLCCAQSTLKRWKMRGETVRCNVIVVSSWSETFCWDALLGAARLVEVGLMGL